MAVYSLTDLVQELSTGPILNAEQRQELSRLQTSFSDVRALARELVKRGWLTPYQVNQLVQGRGRELVLGPYVLLERLGAGGMGTVFEAHHTFLKRPVAIKLINQTQLSSGAERFLLEMQLAAQIDHTHIVRALDAGQADGRYYLAMELIQGLTLARLVEQRGPLPVPWACACIRQSALGLQHASDSGLVHRDIKPSNLMLATPKGAAPVVKVLDLGLARPQGADSGRDLTRTGTLMGTMDYLAPEQALNPRGVDVRADIYSLGCTFFYLLTGRPPFHGGTEAQRLLQHQQQEPPALASLRSDVPPTVAAVVQRMLAKRPEQRFATPGEVAAILEPFASWAGWENVAPTTGIAPSGSTGGSSLTNTPPVTGERGWTLMTDPTRAGVLQRPATGVAGPAPSSMVAPPSGFSIVLPDASQPAGAAPSLVTERAATPEKGWTLLAEPRPQSVAAPVAGKEPSSIVVPAAAAPVPRPGLMGLRRSTWGLIAAGGAAFLVLIGIVLLVRSWFGSSSPELVAVRVPDKGGEQRSKVAPQPSVIEKKGGENKGIEKKGVEYRVPVLQKEALTKSIHFVMTQRRRPVKVRRGDLVYSAYPGGYLGVPDLDDRNSLQVWDVTTMKMVRRFNTMTGMEAQKVLSTDGRWLAGKVGNKIRICHVDDAGREQVGTVPLPDRRADGLLFAGPDRLATLRHGDPSPGIEVWDLNTQKRVLALPLPGGCAANRAVISPDGKLLVIPQNDQLLVQELREGASPTIRPLPKSRGKTFALQCRGLSFALDGSELSGVFEEPFEGWRVLAWDVKNASLQATSRADHGFPKTIIVHEGFYGGPAIECVPSRRGWLLYGQIFVDAGTGKATKAFSPGAIFSKRVVRALTAQYALDCGELEVRVVPLGQGK